MREEIVRWAEPLGLAELGELNAQWLEGLVWGPWQGGQPIDDETWRRLTRCGVVTIDCGPPCLPLCAAIPRSAPAL
jgi:hypothetical protein